MDILMRSIIERLKLTVLNEQTVNGQLVLGSIEKTAQRPNFLLRYCLRERAAASMRLKMATPIMVRASGVRTSSSAGISATADGSEVTATCCSKMERNC